MRRCQRLRCPCKPKVWAPRIDDETQMTQRIHLVLLGDSAVGKTVFSILLKQKKYVPVLCQTVSTELIKHTVGDVEFVLYDIAGSPKYIPLQEPFLKKADAALIFEDATRAESDINWYGLLRKYNSDAKAFHIRVKGENTNAKQLCSWSCNHRGISLGSIELSKEPNLDFEVMEKILHHIRPRPKAARRWFW